jgi:hypothetical protein
MHLFLTSNLKGYYDPQPYYNTLTVKPVTNPTTIPIRNGLFGLRSMTLKKVNIPWVFQNMDTWDKLEGYGRTFYWSYSTGASFSWECPEGNYDLPTLTGLLQAGMQAADPPSGWLVTYNVGTNKVTFTHGGILATQKTFEWTRMPVFARVLGFPITDMVWWNAIPTPSLLDPQPSTLGIAAVYIRLKRINSEDFSIINIQDSDDVFAVFDVQPDNLEKVVYVPPVEHTIFFDQPISHNFMELSFNANFGGLLFPIPFHGRDWTMDILYLTKDTKKILDMKAQYY